MDFRVPWKQNRICALSQFVSDQPQLPNMTLSQFLPHDMSVGWAQPWSLPSHWGCPCFPELWEGRLPVSGSVLLRQLPPAHPCSQFPFLGQTPWLRLDIRSCMASAGDAHQDRGCHCTIPARMLWMLSVSPTSLACSCQPEAGPVAEMPKTLLGSYTGLLLGFYVFTIF